MNKNKLKDVDSSFFDNLDIKPSELDQIELKRIKNLTFEKPDYDNFDCLSIAFEAIQKGGTAPTVMNAANEIAVAKFLNDEIGFLDIPLSQGYNRSHLRKQSILVW